MKPIRLNIYGGTQRTLLPVTEYHDRCVHTTVCWAQVDVKKCSGLGSSETSCQIKAVDRVGIIVASTENFICFLFGTWIYLKSRTLKTEPIQWFKFHQLRSNPDIIMSALSTIHWLSPMLAYHVAFNLNKLLLCQIGCRLSFIIIFKSDSSESSECFKWKTLNIKVFQSFPCRKNTCSGPPNKSAGLASQHLNSLIVSNVEHAGEAWVKLSLKGGICRPLRAAAHEWLLWNLLYLDDLVIEKWVELLGAVYIRWSEAAVINRNLADTEGLRIHNLTLH